MPQIPYENEIVPGTGQSGRGAEPNYAPLAQPLRLDVRPEMFGANVGHAIEHLGGAIEHSGDEIAERANAILQIKNQADADHAMVDFEKEVAQKHAEFGARQGLDAANHLDEYTSWLQSKRDEYANNMPSLIGRTMFNSDSRRVITQNINSAAGHAANEVKQAADQGIQARITTRISRAEAFPDDTKSFDQAVKDNNADQAARGDLHGSTTDKVTGDQYLTTADMRAAQIRGLVRLGNTQRAAALYDKYQADLGARAPEVKAIVDNAVRTVGVRNVTSDIFNGRVGLSTDTKTAVSIIAQKETGGVRGDPYTYVEPSSGALGKYGINPKYLQEHLRSVGMPAMGKDAFLNSPETQDELATKLWDRWKTQTGSDQGAAANWIGHGARGDALGTTQNMYVQDFNQRLAHASGERALVTAGRKAMQAYAPHDVLAPDAAQSAIETQWRKDKELDRDDLWNNNQTIANAFIRPNDSGKLPTTVEELTATPEGKMAWEALPDTQKITWMDKLKHNAEQRFSLSVEGLREIHRLQGLASSSEPEDVRTFLDTDPTSLKIPVAEMGKLMKLQDQVRNRPSGDPRIVQAMGWITDQLQQAGITRASDPDSYATIRGALKGRIEDELAQGIHPDYKKINEIARNLISNEIVQRAWWNPARLFKGDTYTQKFYKSITDGEKAAARKDLGDDATDAQITQFVLRQKYQDKYGISGGVTNPGPGTNVNERINDTFGKGLNAR